MMPGELSKERADFLAADFVQGFPAYVGYVVTRVAWGEFDTILHIEPRHAQQDGFVHAGVMGAMADHTMGYAAYTTVPETQRILSIEYKINFLRPAVGSGLICRAKVVRPGSTVIPVEAEVYSLEKGREVMVAKAMSTMAAVDHQRLQRPAESS